MSSTASHIKKNKKAKKERKCTAVEVCEDAQGIAVMVSPKKTTASSSAPSSSSSSSTATAAEDRLLFQRLAQDMTNGLMNAGRFGAPTESLDLVHRLSYAPPTSTTTTKFTTTTTKEVTVTMEREAASLSSQSRTERVPAPSALDRIHVSDLEDFIQDEKSAFGHISTQVNETSQPHRSHDTAHEANLINSARRTPNTFTLADFAAIAALKSLAERHGRVSHMGMLDPSYTFFVNQARTAALYYKVKNKVAVIGGDPLCGPELFPELLEEFTVFRKTHKYGIAFLGASEAFAKYAKEQNWVTMHFGIERVVNPLTNPILLENGGGRTSKRMVTTNRQLLDPKKGGLLVEVYCPSVAKRPTLEEQLVDVYESWREQRNQSGAPQAYITVYDLFALPDLMTYIYTTDRREGRPNGFAALRKLGANNGFHIDPCIAAPGAPKGITDLLVFSAMALLHKASISYLSFGFEPLDHLGEMTGMPKSVARLTRIVHNEIFRGLRVGRKKEYHLKFRPDNELESRLFLVFPDGTPGLRHMAAIVHHANISVRRLVAMKLKKVSVTEKVSTSVTIETEESKSTLTG